MILLTPGIKRGNKKKEKGELREKKLRTYGGEGREEGWKGEKGGKGGFRLLKYKTESF